MGTAGKAGTFVTDDISIGFVGGVITDDVDVPGDVAVSKSDIDAILHSNTLAKASLKQDAGNTLADIRNANKTPLHQRGIDLLLMASAPPEIASFSRSAPASAASPNSTPYIADLITAARPRYILWSAQDDEVPAGESGYWEREPFGWDSPGNHKEDRFTRAVKLDTFGGPKGAKKFVYAFNLPIQLSKDPVPPAPANSTANPYQKGSRGQKRHALEEQNFIFQNADHKRAKKGAVCSLQIPETACLIAFLCFQLDHLRTRMSAENATHQDIGSKTVHKGINCRKAMYAKSAEAASIESKIAQTRAKSLPMGCGAVGEHFYKHCDNYKPRENLPPITQHECWFCLSNPNVDKSLILAIGNNTYLAMAKGQLIPTNNSGKPPLIPGGGHCLIIPIHHCNTPYALDIEIGQPTIDEIDEVKGKLERLFGEYEAAPVFFELSRQSGRGGHNHVQAVPIPQNRMGELESFLVSEANKQGFQFEKDGAAAVGNLAGRNCFRIDLPGGQKLVHFMRGPFNVQFGREALAKFLNMPDRADWKQCAQSPAEQKQDVQTFKKLYNSFK
ncbi:hypothetical protein QFC22_001935 [Naganishia vaughanmartiniae]|uniref:Uncharacterized protein n=1 Tax=Naganishia vaughanmartiniae TaxID=1424756 RepID=A0ACC2XGJ0_9TREE|nr:hypothetical protein QFC22_001935 [Naganishia vaughanmartiniae]